ncbi:MAG: hypothetical protein CSA75_00650 [Sorangium cellulosum]|nr:MAG: hypothetical protein CSA75_00650 [Sorangium cellulosum]
MNDSAAYREHRARRWLSGGAFGLLGGIALSAIAQGSLGGWIAVASACSLIVGLHTFGRLGADQPTAERPARRKKKRKRKPKDEG